MSCCNSSSCEQTEPSLHQESLIALSMARPICRLSQKPLAII